MSGSCGKADRSAPVVDHHRYVLDTEVVEQSLKYARVLGRRVAVTGRRPGQPEPGVVDGDAAVTVAQPLDQVAVQKRPRRVTVQHQQRSPASLVHVMHGRRVELGEVALKREQVGVNPWRSRGSGWPHGEPRRLAAGRVMGVPLAILERLLDASQRRAVAFGVFTQGTDLGDETIDVVSGGTRLNGLDFGTQRL